MGKVILNLAVSLDGYISRENDDVDFLPIMSNDSKITSEFLSFLADVEIIIMGRESYEKTLSLGEYPFKDKETYVLTRQPLHSEDVHYINKDVKILVEELRSKGNIWLFGGTNVITQFINHNLIDKYVITTIPVLIGKGKPLFKGIVKDMKLQIKKVVSEKDGMTVIYEKEKEDS